MCQFPCFRLWTALSPMPQWIKNLVEFTVIIIIIVVFTPKQPNKYTQRIDLHKQASDSYYVTVKKAV